ncbi:MAG: PhoH family protein, partial [Acidobacteria bacterium]|nr:PhoH family protein [Acidobacteriota bacterium]
IFVLDTSVILHDHRVLSSFEEHDIAVPMTVLEELDQFKKGNSELNRNAREFIRILDQLSGSNLLQEWIPLNGAGSGRVRVIVGGQESHNGSGAFLHSESDHRILGAALSLQKEQGRERKVILVSKDINLRLKARALELPAEDYRRVQIRDLESLYTGTRTMELDGEGLLSRFHEEEALPVEEVLAEEPPAHHFFVLTQGRSSALAWYEPRSRTLRRIVKRSAYGVTPRNAEQCFALHALLDPEVRLVSLTGPAGTGKTLLALAAALEQRSEFRQIYLARPIVPLSSKDIGYLPGDAQSKINPYMQPLWDNLSFIKSRFDASSREHKRIQGMLETEKLQIIPLAYIRGRSFSRVLFIVDEAQNLTPHEVKTIVSRVGEGTKIVFTGDIGQIDHPYLDSSSNGL